MKYRILLVLLVSTICLASCGSVQKSDKTPEQSGVVTLPQGESKPVQAPGDPSEF